MTIFQLECFYALAQSLNYTVTANQQSITQPALSRSIVSIEQELGIQLLNRNTHKVSLTPAGKVFAEECRKMIEVYQQGVQRAQLATQHLIGTIRFGVPIDSYEPLAVELTQALSEYHSGIHIDLKFNSPSGLVRALDDGLIDIIVSSGKPRNANSRFLLIDRRHNYAITPLNHPLANKNEIAFEELRNENFIAISRASSAAGYEAILTLASGAGFTPNIIRQADTVSSLMTMVACGMGVSVLYKEHQPLFCEHIAFIHLKNAPTFDRYLIWNQIGNPCIEAMLAVASKLYPQEMSS